MPFPGEYRYTVPVGNGNVSDHRRSTNAVFPIPGLAAIIIRSLG
jgi:hypothetical protein